MKDKYILRFKKEGDFFYVCHRANGLPEYLTICVGALSRRIRWKLQEFDLVLTRHNNGVFGVDRNQWGEWHVYNNRGSNIPLPSRERRWLRKRFPMGTRFNATVVIIKP